MMKIKVHGAETLHAAFMRLEAEAPGMMRKALAKAAEPICDEARALAPRSDRPGGHLADGIKIRVMPRTAVGHERVRIGVKPGLWYGVFPEFGTAKTAAQPFMRPALDTQKDAALRVLADEISKRMKARL